MALLHEQTGDGTPTGMKLGAPDESAGDGPLVDAFLFSVLNPGRLELRTWLLTTWCYRTGMRGRAGAAPRSRLCAALSRLWHAAGAARTPVLSPG